MVKSVEQGLAFGIMALGVYLTYKVLNFADLTTDGSFPLGAAVAAAMITNGQDPFLATLTAFLAGVLAGGVTGVLNIKAKISDLLAGILTMTSLYSINLRIMGRPNIPLLNKTTVFSVITDAVQRISPAFPPSYINVILFCCIALAVKLLLDAFLQTQLGFALRATGDNPQMVRSLGINTDVTKMIGLCISNGLIAFSGALVAQYQGFADAGMGVGTVVAGLASVIVGDALLGEKTVFMATLGVLFGSFLYRFSISLVLSFQLLQASDLKLLTALVVIMALSLPRCKGALQAAAKRGVSHVSD